MRKAQFGLVAIYESHQIELFIHLEEYCELIKLQCSTANEL